MTACKYCGEDYGRVYVHERFCKMNPKNKQNSETPTNAETVGVITREMTETVYKPHWLKFWKWPIFNRHNKKEILVVETPDELIEGLKLYQITQKNPKSGLGKILNKDKDFIQVVLVSELIEPKTFWAEKDGMNRIRYKDRMYKLPRDIKGNVFFWHIDKKEPLIDSAHADQSDAESSFHELQLFNMAYSVGRAAGANDLMNNLKLILMMIGVIILLCIGILYYLNTIQKGISVNDTEILNTLRYINQTLPRNY